MADEVVPQAGPGWVSVFPTGVAATISVGNAGTMSSYEVTGQALQASVGIVTHKLGCNLPVTSDPLQTVVGIVDVRTGSTIAATGFTMQSRVSAVGFSLGTGPEIIGNEITATTGNITHKLGYALSVTDNALRIGVGSIMVVGRVYLPNQAFPSDNPAGYSSGMTLRQWYAGQALSGFIANSVAANLIDHLPSYVFKLADSMIAYEARNPASLVVPRDRPPAVAPPPPAEAPNVFLLRQEGG